MPGTLFVVATPIGNLEDITARALRVLREVAVIAAEDTRRTAQLLTRYRDHDADDELSRTQRREESRVAHRAASSAARAWPSCPTPGRRRFPIRGSGLIRDAIEAGIRVEAIPGANAALTALAASGLSERNVHVPWLPAD